MGLKERLNKWREKRRKPFRIPSYKAKKIGKVVFWVLFLWMFTVSITGLITNNKLKAMVQKGPDSKVQLDQNGATRPEAVEFTKQFAKEYFTWKRGDNERANREGRLKPYLLEGADPQAGLDMHSLQWDANYVQASIVRVKETGKQSADMVLKVDYKLTRQDEGKDVTETIVVPIQTDGKGFIVTGNPQVVKVDNKAKIKVDKDEKKSDEADYKAKQEIRDFLPTFFKSYTTATQKELEYVLHNKDIKGLEGALHFEQIKEAKVYVGSKKGTYEVYTIAEMKDAVSESKMTMKYVLTVKKEGKQYIVTDMTVK
ncbi:conjugal transfer protein [Bacillus cereus]|uniref:conjugal transfer protein n=1 Tax=Bacillus cereus TaxID=1396 RepID=UPI003C6CC519